MAKCFLVTIPGGACTIRLDSQGRASVQYTAKNVSAAPIDGRAVLVSVPQTSPPSRVVQKGWVNRARRLPPTMLKLPAERRSPRTEEGELLCQNYFK